MEIEIDNIKIRTVEAYNEKHGGKVKLMHKKGIGVGYVITIAGKTIYHAGLISLFNEKMPQQKKRKNIGYTVINGKQ